MSSSSHVVPAVLTWRPAPNRAKPAPDGAVEGELVAAGVQAELQRGGQSVLLHRERNDGEVLVELPLELGDIAHIINALVEAARELGCDGLQGNPLVGERGEDDEQFGGVWGLSVSSIETSVMNLPSPLASAMWR